MFSKNIKTFKFQYKLIFSLLKNILQKLNFQTFQFFPSKKANYPLNIGKTFNDTQSSTFCDIYFLQLKHYIIK